MPVSVRMRNLRVAALAGALAAAMLGLAYASVPLYRLFCQVTGFGGTPQRAEAAPGAGGDTIAIRFDANVSGALGWSFHAAQPVMHVTAGEQSLAHYTAINRSGTTITGRAVFNVTPPSAGIYFNKIECFCFSEQTLAPGQRADLPVVFFVDPDIRADAETAGVREITLSYTFYPAEGPQSVSRQSALPAEIAN
jgi:cytochrome c oxidase assembly protein subunit 11